MTLALESGETEGVCGLSWSTMKAARPHWIKDNKLNVIVQLGLAKLPELRNVPAALDLVTDPVKKQVLELILIRQEIGRPVAAPPGVPAERLDILRRAFEQSMKDPEFLAEAEKLQLEIEPLSAREIDTFLANAFGGWLNSFCSSPWRPPLPKRISPRAAPNPALFRHLGWGRCGFPSSGG